MKKWHISANYEDGKHVSKSFATEHEAEEYGYMLYGKGYDNIDIWRD